MTKASWIIRDEHRRLNAVLYCLGGVIRDVDKGSVKPDFGLFHSLLNYIQLFLANYHHPKENDYLFKALRRRIREAERTLDELDAEHARGDELLVDLHGALRDYERRGGSAFGTFRDAAIDYIDFERKHAAKEEGRILPLAENSLSDEDWREIEAAFTDRNDPFFGEERRQEFERLNVTIANRAPAPHGLARRRSG
jgi:branched-chain amino acid transport system ATP-binding protein